MSLIYSHARIARFIIITLLLVILVGITLPAGATPPEQLNFKYDLVYSDLPAQYGYGTWEANGVFAGEGDLFQDPNHSGWDPEGCWRTVHMLDTLTDENEDTITIRGQVTKIEGQPGCLSFTAKVNWAIIDGTGAYEGLNGQGQGDASGYLEINNGQLDFVLHLDLFGQGHFD